MDIYPRSEDPRDGLLYSYSYRVYDSEGSFIAANNAQGSGHYSSVEQALRAENERQRLILAEVLRALGAVIEGMFIAVDSEDVYVSVEDGGGEAVARLNAEGAKAVRYADALIKKLDGGK